MKEKEVILSLIVSPNSCCFRLKEFDEAKLELSLSLRSPPDKGKANKELLKELKKIFHTGIEIVSGKASKKKRVRVKAPEEKVRKAIQNSLKP